MSHLQILANGQPLVLMPDQSIDIDMQNPLFNDAELYSYPIDVPIDGNRHFLQNVDDRDSILRPVSLEHTPMQIFVDGIPLATGTSVMQDDEEVSDSMAISIDESTMTFSDLISDLNCNDIPVRDADRDDLRIGEKIGDVYVNADCDVLMAVDLAGTAYCKSRGETYQVRCILHGHTLVEDIDTKFTPQALGFSYQGICQTENAKCKAVVQSTRTYNPGDSDGTISVNIPQVKKVNGYDQKFINVNTPYGDTNVSGRRALFANARVCYNHYKIGSDGDTSDEQETEVRDGEPENFGKYWVLDADRQQSGVCFFVLYFLDCLFDYLGVAFDKSALMEVDDLRRLVFFTTKCSYDTAPQNYGSLYTADDAEVKSGLKSVGDIKTHLFVSEASHGDQLQEWHIDEMLTDVNAWCESRGTGGKIAYGGKEDTSVKAATFTTTQLEMWPDGGNRMVWDEQRINQATVSVVKDGDLKLTTSDDWTFNLKVKSEVARVHKLRRIKISTDIVSMFANGKNFPSQTVQSVIDSLYNSFGIKFDYSYQDNTVRAYLVRDVFRKASAPRELRAKVYEMVPMSEKITGVRVCYSDESDSKEQRDNVSSGVKDYDTTYDYIDYTPENVVTGQRYADFFRQLSSTDMHCYIDTSTGNAYRVKIDSEYTSVATMKPVLFEVGQYKGVTLRGIDSSGKLIFRDSSTMQDKSDEDFIQELASDFQPIVFNDVNYRTELSSITSGYAEALLAAFVDEDMEHEFLRATINYALSSSVVDIKMSTTLRLVESYDPSGSDDANSPLQTKDWGLAIAIMRGGGASASRRMFDTDYDSFGNSKWTTEVGSYTMSSDTIDQFCNKFPSVSDGKEHFSLKVRAAKSLYFDLPGYSANTPLCDDSVARRGLFETFLADLAVFIMSRKKYKVRCLMSAAELIDIRNHWRDWWTINGKRCLINKVSTSISEETGIDSCELEVFSF